MKNILLVIVVFLILFIYLSNYQQIEAFGAIKRRTLGYDGLSVNGTSEYTTDPDTLYIVKKVCKNILDEINKKTKMSYHLGKIDQINQECVGCGQTFIVDVFVHEVKHSFTRRFIMDFTIMKNADVRVNKVNQSNAMHHAPKLYMDLPANELILTDENMENNHHVMGTPDSSIDFSQYKGDTSDKELNNNAYQSIITDRRSGLYKDWILPVEMEHHNKTTKNTKCHQVANNPTINMSQTDKNEYSWMFDRSRGITQFPHSTAI
jgi:hypothetical protein